MAADRKYWLNLFTGTTWNEFLNAGATITGFSEVRWKTLQRVNTGDYFLCYITGISRFVAILEVISEPFQDSSPVWEDKVFPSRVGVKMVESLTPETAVPVHLMKDRLSIFENLTNPNGWTGKLRGSPTLWSLSDGEAVVSAVFDAKKNPVVRDVDQRKLDRRPKGHRAAIGPVSIPEDNAEPPGPTEPSLEVSKHTLIQWTLLKLGNDMGVDVWAARNDRGREYEGKKFTDIPRLLNKLPIQFDPVTNRTIEHIDVLWFTGNAITAAFEIESTTSIYSGLLRMSDLISMIPNLNIPLYIVAPDQKREKVFAEVNRPTFSKLSPPMTDICRYISFSGLMDQIGKYADVIQHLKPDFLDELSESCEVDED